MASSTISFGLVSLPVKLFSMGESQARIGFNLLHEECGTRLRQRYACPRCEVDVSREEMIKGYQFAKDQYVLFSSEELEAIEAQATESIEITEFIPADQVDRIFFDKGYYLGPDRGGARAYRLLAAALRETDRVALAKHSARGRQYLVMIRPLENGLVLEQLRYPDEIRSFSEVPVEDGEVAEAELKLAVQLIDASSSEAFHPESYKDEVRLRILDLIERKVQGEEITVSPTEEPETKIIDLMEALKASLTATPEDAEDRRKPPARAEPAAGANTRTTRAKKASTG